MPNNKFDSKSFNAEAFKYMVARVPNLNMNEIKKSRALAANPDIQEVFLARKSAISALTAVLFLALAPVNAISTALPIFSAFSSASWAFFWLALSV